MHETPVQVESDQPEASSRCGDYQRFGQPREQVPDNSQGAADDYHRNRTENDRALYTVIAARIPDEDAGRSLRSIPGVWVWTISGTPDDGRSGGS